MTKMTKFKEALDALDSVKRGEAVTREQALTDYADFIARKFDVVIANEQTIRTALELAHNMTISQRNQ